MAKHYVEYHSMTKEKAKLPRGKWKQEPDKIHWIDEATDMDCLIVRNESMGNLCGYVGVTHGHPCFEKDYDQCDARAHGGLTFSDFCHEGPDPGRGICHVPAKGRPERVWWLGFDCAHVWDRVPGMKSWEVGTYRDVEYVKAECASLAAQLKAMEVTQ